MPTTNDCEILTHIYYMYTVTNRQQKTYTIQSLHLKTKNNAIQSPLCVDSVEYVGNILLIICVSPFRLSTINYYKV